MKGETIGNNLILFQPLHTQPTAIYSPPPSILNSSLDFVGYHRIRKSPPSFSPSSLLVLPDYYQRWRIAGRNLFMDLKEQESLEQGREEL